MGLIQVQHGEILCARPAVNNCIKGIKKLVYTTV